MMRRPLIRCLGFSNMHASCDVLVCLPCNICVFKMCFFPLSLKTQNFILFQQINNSFFLPNCPVSHCLPSSTLQQMIPPLLALSQNRSKLKLYIAHLTDLCHDRDPSILSQLTPPTHYHHSDPDHWEEELQKMSVEQVAARSAQEFQLGRQNKSCFTKKKKEGNILV